MDPPVPEHRWKVKYLLIKRNLRRVALHFFFDFWGYVGIYGIPFLLKKSDQVQKTNCQGDLACKIPSFLYYWTTYIVLIKFIWNVQYFNSDQDPKLPCLITADSNPGTKHYLQLFSRSCHLVRELNGFLQWWGSVTFWCGSGSADSYFWLMNPDLDPTPYPTPFFSDFKDAKKNFVFIFFLITYPQAHYLQS